ncbi:hypothetical protein C2G38_2136886 [Gigaspora rosea]|uniref:Uncharacterized protein n=1 Tax=Gigaspora rosea TaxID=44941 RepID=A0A397W7M8_9GLOM|nr:hypothetical protein C2G38_2136886 [Gigaspora rosea]
MGLFMTFEGTIISTTKLHDALIDYGGILKYWVVVPISSPSDGFLFYCRGANINGEIIEIASEIIQTKIKVVSVTAFYVLERGSVTSIGKMTNVNFTYGFNLIPLRFGGYLILVYQGDINFGYVLNEDGNVYSNWSLPQPLVLPKYQSAYVVLVNNSFVFVENQNNSIWNVTRDDLYRFYRQDNRLNNPIIESTSPIIGSQVNESTKKLQFTFAYPVTLSNSNISIYQQINGSNDLLRQRFQGDASSQLCHLYSNDNKTVIIQVFPSTFNEPNSLYYVTIENNFVKRSDSDEALLGIDKNLWTLTTVENKNYVYSSQITGVIRLTPDGSNHYLSLSSVDQQKFHKQLATDLSSIIPVEDNRLTAADGLEKDMSTGSLQILLPFNIKDTTNLSKKSANKIYQDFNTLLKYKEYSALMNYNTTILIDETYPMTIAPFLLRDYTELIIGIVLLTIALLILYFLASRKFKKARNLAMFNLIFIVIDLGLRISFFVNDAHKVPELYVPTLIILIISIFINTSASFAITIHEISKNPDFSKWASKYGQFLPILTIISAGRIEALNVLTSKFGMLEIFSATFSEVAEKIIFFVGILCLFVCEIPQFIIQQYFGV